LIYFQQWFESTKNLSPLFKNIEEIKTYLNENSEELLKTLQGKTVRKKDKVY
jgi:hypothetical protein